jgi:hypothetical protein
MLDVEKIKYVFKLSSNVKLNNELWKHSQVDIKVKHDKCNHMLAT